MLRRLSSIAQASLDPSRENAIALIILHSEIVFPLIINLFSLRTDTHGKKMLDALYFYVHVHVPAVENDNDNRDTPFERAIVQHHAMHRQYLSYFHQANVLINTCVQLEQQHGSDYAPIKQVHARFEAQKQLMMRAYDIMKECESRFPRHNWKGEREVKQFFVFTCFTY
jgi:hypothetical protein